MAKRLAQLKAVIANESKLLPAVSEGMSKLQNKSHRCKDGAHVYSSALVALPGCAATLFHYQANAKPVCFSIYNPEIQPNKKTDPETILLNLGRGDSTSRQASSKMPYLCYRLCQTSLSYPVIWSVHCIVIQDRISCGVQDKAAAVGTTPESPVHARKSWGTFCEHTCFQQRQVCKV